MLQRNDAKNLAASTEGITLARQFGSGTGAECAQWAQRMRRSVENRKEQWFMATMRASRNADTVR